MISGRISLYTACILLVSATSSFSDDRNDFTDAQSVLEHLGITVVKTEKDLAPGPGAELSSSRLPRQVVLQSSPNSRLRVASATITSSPKRPDGRQFEKVYFFGSKHYYIKFPLEFLIEFQWGSDELVDRDVEAPVKNFLLIVDDEQRVCHKGVNGGIIEIKNGFPSRFCAIGSGAQYPVNFSSGYAILIVIGADSEGAPWRLLEFQRMYVSR